ncbi:MAG: carboxylesterase family protein [Solirubrobacteraceae bacterium]|nr:alpha/beta hydrolase fold domain-containing protein [Patulibacter sp.]
MPRRHRRSMRRRSLVALTALAALPSLALASCGSNGSGGDGTPAPTSQAGERYRDLLFDDITTTDGTIYTTTKDDRGAAEPLALDRYAPDGDTAKDRAAIIWMHGGGFSGGNRKDGDMVTLAKQFARRGYVTFSIDYRLLAGDCGAKPVVVECLRPLGAAVHDERAALDYVRAHAPEFGIDPDRIALGGESAGAIASIQTAGQPTSTPNPVAAVVSLSGGVPPSVTLKRTAAPMLFQNGTDDQVVPLAWPRANTRDLRAKGVTSRMYLQRGAAHVPRPADLTAFDRRARDFLLKTLHLGTS